MTKEAISTERALKLALDALGEIEWSNNSQWQSDRAKVVIAALREALTSGTDGASEAKEQPAQQEPVGCEGAIVNSRVYADRLEHDYKFECEAGPLHLCTDWVEFRRCFEWLAQHTSPPTLSPAQRQARSADTWVGLDNDDLVWIYSNSDKVGQAISNTEAKLKEKNT